MKNRLLSLFMLLILLISTIPIILNIKPAEASITGPNLIVDDTVSQIHARLVAAAGSAVTVKQTVTNLAVPDPEDPDSISGPAGLKAYYFDGSKGLLNPSDGNVWEMSVTNIDASLITGNKAFMFIVQDHGTGSGWESLIIQVHMNFYGAGGHLLQSFDNGWVLKSSHGFNPGDVPGKFDLRMLVKDLGSNYQVTPQFRLPGGVWQTFFDGSWISANYELTKTRLAMQIDAGGGGTVTFGKPLAHSNGVWYADPNTTIQAAINAASSGETIYVYDGIYNENLVVNKALTIEAACTPVIDGGAAGNCISVSANNVVISGFEIRNGYNGISGQTSGSTFSNNIIHDNLNIPGSAGVGILLWGDNDNNIIMGNTIYDNDRQGIFIGYYDTTYISTGNIISYNTIYNNGLYRYANGPDASDYGIQLWTADNNIIEYNEIYNHDDWFPWGGTFDFAQGIYLCDSDSNLVTHNYLHGNNYGVGLWHPSRPVVTNNINYNNIAGNTGYGVCTFDGSPPVDARFNWWGDASGPTHPSNVGGFGDRISGNVDYSPWLGATFETTPRTYHVNPSGAPGAIQEAINEASSGDMIIVHDGTYDEQVVIDKSLTLQGGSTPIVKPSSAAILTTVLDGLFSGGIKQIAGIIVANAAGGSVTVKNIIVDGENIIAKPPGADYVAGIFYRETGGTIDTVTVANMTIGSTGTAVRGYGVYLSAITYTVLVEIEYCTIINYDKNAIDVHGYKLSVNIHDNTLTGRGPLPNGDEVQNGVVVMDGATGTVDYNDISNMAYTPETWWSAGIMFLESDGSAEGNIITNCQIGIIFQDGSGSAQTNTVAGGTVGLLGIWAQYTTAGTWTANFVGNTISGVRDSPGYENGAIGAQSWDAGSSLVVTIHNNKILGDGSTSADGIYIGDVPEYEPAGNIQVIITSNTISGWQNGIHLVSSVDAGSISNNNITDTYLGIFVESATSVQICNNRLIDFVKGGIVTRGAKNIFIEGNTISTTLHDEAPNGIDIGTYTGTNGTVKGNKISGCSWNGFTGDYETSWSGSGILVIESGDSLEVIGNTVHNCDVGMDIESDSTKITCNDVHNNIYGLVFWNAKPQVNYNNIYDNIQYGVYRTTSGNLTDALDARYNWWGNTTGPHHPTLNPTGSGDNVSDYVSFAPWLLQEKVPPLIHDVAVISVVPNVTQQYPGRIVNITVVVKNNGNMYETFNVTAYRDSIPIGTILVTDLGIGENTTLIFNWNTSGLTPCHLWTIKAEAAVVGDINPSDNTLIDGTVKIAIMGDMNGDGKVDISDLVMAVNAIPSIPGWSNWNPNADLNNDNRVDIADLVRIIAYCGQAC